ncbi:MAG: hypothetical protein ACOX5G_13160 [Kiritimatiellia bacterium]|jgi:hypothetical protein
MEHDNRDAMPVNGCLPDEDAEAVAEKLRRLKASCGIANFVLYGPTHVVRQTGYWDVDDYRKLGRKFRAVADLVRSDGIQTGFFAMPTMNVGVNHPWRAYVRADGQERPFTPCPADPGFRAHFAEKFAAFSAEFRPFLFMMDDDFRYFFDGCFCEEHVRRFADLTGVGRTREELAALFSTPAGDALRAAWHRMQADDVRAVAAAASAAIAQASPETRIGICAPGAYPEDETAALARILAGRHRPVVRWWGAIYDFDRPVDLAGILFSAQWARENLPRDIEALYESDPVPHSAFYASGARTAALCSCVSALGFDGIYHFGVGLTAEDLRTSEYLDEYRRESTRWHELMRRAQEGRSVGVGVAYEPSLRFRASTNERRIEVEAAARTFNLLGIPMTTEPSVVTAYVGAAAFEGKSDEEVRRILSGRVFLDGAAAEALTARGFSSDIGARATPRDKIDFTGERVVEDGALLASYFHQNFGLDGSAVSRVLPCGAHEDSVYYRTEPAEYVQGSLVRFENARGGRVVTLAANLAWCKSPNVFSFRKRELLVSAIRWLGGADALPVVADREAAVLLIANEDAAKTRLLVHAVNLSCDERPGYAFAVSPHWVGGRVERLEADGSWRAAEAAWTDAQLTIRGRFPVYRSLTLRILKESSRL